MSLLVVGTVAFDDIETPFGRAERIVGGAAMYIAWAASYFAEDVRMVSVIGGDFPQSALDELRARGVNTDGIQLLPDQKSFFWAGRYHHNMNARDTLITDLNVLADFNPVLPESYKHSDFVMLGNLTPAVQQQVIRQLAQPPRVLALDTMNFWMDHAMDELKAVLRHIDVLIINDEEARQLADEYSLVRASEIITRMGPSYVVIKKGEHGALLFGDGQVFFAPALPLLDVQDPTGAGDTFAGGVMGFLASRDSIHFEVLKQAIVCGSAMASFCVEKFGTEGLKNLSLDEVQERLDAFTRLVNFESPLVGSV